MLRMMVVVVVVLPTHMVRRANEEVAGCRAINIHFDGRRSAQKLYTQNGRRFLINVGGGGAHTHNHIQDL